MATTDCPAGRSVELLDGTTVGRAHLDRAFVGLRALARKQVIYYMGVKDPTEKRPTPVQKTLTWAQVCGELARLAASPEELCAIEWRDVLAQYALIDGTGRPSPAVLAVFRLGVKGGRLVESVERLLRAPAAP